MNVFSVEMCIQYVGATLGVMNFCCVRMLEGTTHHRSSGNIHKRSLGKPHGTVGGVTLPARFLVKWTVSSVAVTVNAAADKKNTVANLIMAFIDTKTQI